MANGADPPQTNKNVIFVVILTFAVCVVLGVGTFAYCMLFNVTPDGVIVTAFSSVVTACIGYLAGVLSKTSPTESTKTVTVSDQPTVTDATPKPDEPPKT